MGLTAWVGRYRLPNARETPRCEWEMPEPAAAEPPTQRLHALLEMPSPATPRPASTGDSAPSKPRRGKARALLGEEDPQASSSSTSETPAVDAPAANASSEPLEALRFEVQLAALEGRWLILLPGEAAPDGEMQRLLQNLLLAAGITLGSAPVFQAFRWPMMAELPVDAPLEEARDGLRAFIEGRRRAGWRPERLLIFGRHPVLEQVLALQDEHCPLLDVPGWQGPALVTLGGDAQAKRALMALLPTWRSAWFGAVGDAIGDGRDDD
nr:hypothetical protein [Halomonas populi]